MEQIDLNRLRTISSKMRRSKISLEKEIKIPASDNIKDFIKSLPDVLKGKEFKELVNAILQAYYSKKQVSVMMGAHVIKCKLNPWLIALMKAGVIKSLSINGACIIHDTESALFGQTSEDVGTGLKTGDFGNAEETAEFINTAIKIAAHTDRPLAEVLGESLVNAQYANASLLVNAFRLNIPITVHIAIGTDIIHQHPSTDGAATGKASYNDFKRLIEIVSKLEGGVLLNFGSAVIMPEVFLKALNAARNLGYKVKHFTTANFDMIQHYRPQENIVKRPTSSGGKGYSITGHHEIMIPLLAKAVLVKLDEYKKAKNRL